MPPKLSDWLICFTLICKSQSGLFFFVLLFHPCLARSSVSQSAGLLVRWLRYISEISVPSPTPSGFLMWCASTRLQGRDHSLDWLCVFLYFHWDLRQIEFIIDYLVLGKWARLLFKWLRCLSGGGWMLGAWVMVAVSVALSILSTGVICGSQKCPSPLPEKDNTSRM